MPINLQADSLSERLFYLINGAIKNRSTVHESRVVVVKEAEDFLRTHEETFNATFKTHAAAWKP